MAEKKRSRSPEWGDSNALQDITKAVTAFELNRPSIDTDKLARLKNAVPHKLGAKIPDLVEVITAWRAWSVSRNPELRLGALAVSHIWEPKKIAKARCHLSMPWGFVPACLQHLGPAPDFNCSCGFYGFKELDVLIAALGNTPRSSIPVVGKVSLWGRVVETTNGWRAEKAYPSELWLLDNALEDLGRIYDVPMRMVE